MHQHFTLYQLKISKCIKSFRRSTSDRLEILAATMIIASRSPPGDRNHGTVPNVAANGIGNEPTARFQSSNVDTPVIYPKRIFADDPSVENQPTTRFRLPPRYRDLHSDDRDDGRIGKDKTTVNGVAAPVSSSTAPELRNTRHFQEIQIRSEHPANAVQYYHNRHVMTSWTAAAVGATEQGPSTLWQRHYLDDTRRIQTAPVGQERPGYADTRANTQTYDRASSIPVRQAGLLSDMRSIYTLGASLPSSTTVAQQRPPPGMRYMTSQEMAHTTHNRTVAPTNNALSSSRASDASLNTTSTNTLHYAAASKFNHSDRSMVPPSSTLQNWPPERRQWRHPNGIAFEQFRMEKQPPIVNHESESRLSTTFPLRAMHSHSSKSQSRNCMAATRADPNVKSGKTQVVSSGHTNQPHTGTTSSQPTFLQIVPRDQPQQPELRYHPKNQTQRQTTAAPPAPPPPPVFEKVKGFDKLDLLCTATLEIGELHDNPTGCSCPKSKCVALYCDCFKAGRRCHPNRCSCYDCKNTIAESGVDGARTKAIRNILARNPRAFNTAGMGNPLHKLPPGEVACNCVRSKCLKLYCSCFHHGKLCRPDICTCVGCENIISTDDTCNGNREAAIQHVMEKRADAFVIKPKVIGQGCACKNNKCLRKYCECYRTGLKCNPLKCTCRDCENRNDNVHTNYPTIPQVDGPPILSSEASKKIPV